MTDTMQPIPEFNSAERWVIESALKERYGHFVPIELADSELKLDPGALMPLMPPPATRMV